MLFVQCDRMKRRRRREKEEKVFGSSTRRRCQWNVISSDRAMTRLPRTATVASALCRSGPSYT